VVSDLADDRDVVGGRECFANELIGPAVAVELRRVDVVDAELDGPAQQGDSGRAVLPQAFELHRPITDARHAAIAEPGSAAGTGFGTGPGARFSRVIGFCVAG